MLAAFAQALLMLTSLAALEMEKAASVAAIEEAVALREAGIEAARTDKDPHH